MKIKPYEYDGDIELVVPKVIEDAYKKGKGPKEYYFSEMGDFYDWWMGGGDKLFEPKKNKLVDKEIAEFFIDMFRTKEPEFSHMDADEYSPSSTDWLTFIDNGYKYSVCVYRTESCGYKLISTKNPYKRNKKGGDKK